MEQQIFPEIVLFPRVERAAAFVKSVWNAGRHVELCLTEHPHKEPKQPELEFGE